MREDYEARGGPIAADFLEEHSLLEGIVIVEAIKRLELHFDHRHLAGNRDTRLAESR